MNTISMQTVTITAETLQVLAKQKEFGNLVALYITYVEITTWQRNNSVKATTEFMAKRLRWDRHKIIRLKKILISLDLVRDVIKKDDKGKVIGHFILVRHVYADESNHPAENPQGGNNHSVEFEQTSAKDLKESAKDLKESTLDAETALQLQTIYTAYLTHVKLDVQALRNMPVDMVTKMLDDASKKYRLTPKRKAKVLTRLKDSGYDACLKAIQNIGKSDWHRDNGDGEWYAHIDWIFGSYEKTEEWSNKNGN